MAVKPIAHGIAYGTGISPIVPDYKLNGWLTLEGKGRWLARLGPVPLYRETAEWRIAKDSASEGGWAVPLFSPSELDGLDHPPIDWAALERDPENYDGLPYCFVAGALCDGLEFWGPFQTYAAAETWARRLGLRGPGPQYIQIPWDGTFEDPVEPAPVT